MMKKLALRYVGTGLFALSLVVSGLTFATVVSAQEEEEEGAACPKCNEVDLTCLGSTCTCQWGFAGHKCVP
jgi:hypothetical protein